MAASNTRHRRTCGVAEGPCALRHWSASHSPQARTYTSTIPSSTRFRLLFLLALQTVSSLLPCLHFCPIYLILHAFRVLLCRLHALPPHLFDPYENAQTLTFFQQRTFLRTFLRSGRFDAEDVFGARTLHSFHRVENGREVRSQDLPFTYRPH